MMFAPADHLLHFEATVRFFLNIASAVLPSDSGGMGSILLFFVLIGLTEEKHGKTEKQLDKRVGGGILLDYRMNKLLVCQEGV